MRFSVSKEVLEKIMNYIATKPFNEVAQLIQLAQQDIKPIVNENTALEKIDSSSDSK